MSDLSRVEQLLRNALGEDIYKVTPQSRVEVLLAQLNELIEGLDTSVNPEAITGIVTRWLAENIHDGAVVDSSLSVAGAAADAKKTGDELSDLKEGLSDMNTATASDVGKYLRATAVKNGKVTGWQFSTPSGGGGGGGQDGFSPIVAVTNITGGHRVSITDADGTKTFDVMDGTTPSLTNYVQFTDLATTSRAGAMSAQDKSRLDDVYADYSSALTALGVI